MSRVSALSFFQRVFEHLQHVQEGAMFGVSHKHIFAPQNVPIQYRDVGAKEGHLVQQGGAG